mgnify:CR=1 FL=1
MLCIGQINTDAMQMHESKTVIEKMNLRPCLLCEYFNSITIGESKGRDDSHRVTHRVAAHAD